MRVAIIGAGHWHVPLYYLLLTKVEGVELVALSDPCEKAIERARGTAPAAHGYADYREMLDAERPELVFAHAPHDEMTELAAYLVDAGVAFHMEKPMGMDADALAQVAEAARAKELFISLPFVSRYFGLTRRLVELRQAGELGEAFYYYYRLFAGPPSRYIDWHVPWMLDPAKAGPGALYNFGPHGVDLMLALTGWTPKRVFARGSHRLHGEAIPDVVSLMAEADEGRYGVCEFGYNLEVKYERSVTISTDTIHYSGPPDIGTFAFRDGREEAVDGPDAEEAYWRYTSDVVRRFGAGEPPMAGIDDMVKTLRVLVAARKSLETGEVVECEGR